MIAILMSTYNGAKYLSQQIDSIIGQTYKDWTLIIRDDGSTDETLRIIKKYISSNKKIKLFEDKVKHRGCAQSFLYMMKIIDAEYYMFADQDDVWLANKIESCIDLLKEKNINNSPILIHSDLTVVDKDLKTIEPSFWKYCNFHPFIGKSKLLPVFNYVTGCTMFFNKMAKDVCVSNSSKAVMHDYWVALNVIFNKGIILQIDKPTILYRQHSLNVLGARKPISLIKKWVDIMNVIKDNYIQFKMINSITRFSLTKYLFYKCIVILKKAGIRAS